MKFKFLTKTMRKIFNKELPSLNSRESRFKEIFIKFVNELSEVKSSFSVPEVAIGIMIPMNQYYREINHLLGDSELEKLRIIEGLDYTDLLKQVDEFELLLYFFSIIISESKIKKISEHNIDKLIEIFNEFEFPYVLQIRNNSYIFERILNTSTQSIININSEMIKLQENEANRLDYDKCVQDFIRISKSTLDKSHYINSLSSLKKVLERSIDNRLQLRIHDVKKVIQKLSADNSLQSQLQNVFTFIVKNIHHDQKDTEGVTTSMNFSKNSYMYWWLEIDKLIFLVNQT
jgi:hypothetical protein